LGMKRPDSAADEFARSSLPLDFSARAKREN
jgi:hypothetical protein